MENKGKPDNQVPLIFISILSYLPGLTASAYPTTTTTTTTTTSQTALSYHHHTMTQAHLTATIHPHHHTLSVPISSLPHDSDNFSRTDAPSLPLSPSLAVSLSPAPSQESVFRRRLRLRGSPPQSFVAGRPWRKGLQQRANRWLCHRDLTANKGVFISPVRHSGCQTRDDSFFSVHQPQPSGAV